MKKPIDKEITETWNIFSDNLILFVPDAFVQCLSFLVYGAIVGIFATSFTADLSFSGFDFRNPLTFPIDQIVGFMKQFITYICGAVIVLFFYHFLIGIIHGAGWNNMFSKAATTGHTSISDYFSGIAKFSSRMFWSTAIRMSILWLPWLVIGCMMAAFALSAGSNSNGAPAVIFFLGIPICFITNLVTRFLMMMWKPAMFTRDMQPVDSLLEASNFIFRQMNNLIIYLVIWVIFKSLIGRFSGLFLTTFNSNMIQNDFNGATFNFDLSNFLLPLSVWILVWTIMYCARIFALVFCYKFYSEKFDEPAPVKIPKQYPLHPNSPQRSTYGSFPSQYTGVPYPQQQNYPPQQPPFPQQNFPSSQYAPPPQPSQYAPQPQPSQYAPQPPPPPYYYPPQPPQTYYQPPVYPYPYQQPPAPYQQTPYPQYQPPYQPPPQTQPTQPTQPPLQTQSPQPPPTTPPATSTPPSGSASAFDSDDDTYGNISNNEIPTDNLTQASSDEPAGEHIENAQGGDEQRPPQT